MCVLSGSQRGSLVSQGVAQELVHLGDLGRNGQVDGSVTNLNNKSSNNIRIDLYLSVSRSDTNMSCIPYLVGNLQLLALTDVG